MLFTNYLYLFFMNSWLYTEHRKDRQLLEQEKKAKSKEEENDSKIAKWQVVSEKKPEVPTMNGIANAAFESDHL